MVRVEAIIKHRKLLAIIILLCAALGWRTVMIPEPQVQAFDLDVYVVHTDKTVMALVSVVPQGQRANITARAIADGSPYVNIAKPVYNATGAVFNFTSMGSAPGYVTVDAVDNDGKRRQKVSYYLASTEADPDRDMSGSDFL
ncbi:MAG: hypothetical protein MUD10_05430 [Candidatus Pacebacteria bacterium]|nr:hypothetical protein [Candidatus Paceibacterota bacterium]